MKSAQVRALFDELKSELVPLIATLAEHRASVDPSILHGAFPIDRQRELVAQVLGLMGFDRSGWRMDDTVHPFATGIGAGDVRITTRWEEPYYASGLYGAMHECGHGLYEDGIAESLRRTPLGHGESLGLHESQSRMWENMVGRGRAFSGVLAPRINATVRQLGRAGRPVPRRQLHRADVHPRRGRRGDLRTAHRAALRARAGADRRAGSRSRISPRRGTPASRTISASRSPTTPTASSRTSTGPAG